MAAYLAVPFLGTQGTNGLSSEKNVSYWLFNDIQY